jgi:Acyl-CoA dehydrogenase, C-terminal domain
MIRCPSPVAHQSASSYKITVRISRRNLVDRRQGGKLHLAAGEDCVGSDEEGIRAPARSASPSAAWNWPRHTQSSVQPSAGRLPTASRSSGCSPTCISSSRWAAFGLQGRRLARQGDDASWDAYICKYFADEMAFKAADMCMQIHGGIALTTDLPIEKFWRQQRSLRITEGATEVMKMVIARHVMKTYGSAARCGNTRAAI